jgi:hypothetical protein
MKAKLLGMMVIGLAVCAHASLKSDMDSMNTAVQKALMKKDIAGFKKAVKAGSTSDFKYIERGKTMDLDTMCEMMKQGLGSLTKVTEASTKIKDLKEKGNTATCTAIHTMKGTMMGPDKKSHKMVMIGTSKDTYKKVNGKWKMSIMEWTADKMTMDGKPMDMSKMGG